LRKLAIENQKKEYDSDFYLEVHIPYCEIMVEKKDKLDIF
jgi:hypothetical protein